MNQVYNMTVRIPLLIALILPFCLLGCYTESSYQGDGHLTDHGWKAPHNRYILDLGPIDLTIQEKYQYTLANLPSEEFTVGLQISALTPEEDLLNLCPVDGSIRIELVNRRGQVVIQEEASLIDWVWSGSRGTTSFVYRRGREREVQLDQNTTRYERIGVRADEGWGTYFRPRRHETYHLRIEIVKVSQKQYPARILITGGGWK